MPKITYVQPDGTAQSFEVENGLSVMRGAVDNGVDGILAECGGACACATCMVFVDTDWVGRLLPPEAMEESMLDEDEGGTNRRLSCQIAVTDAVDGLVVHVPPSQY